MELFIHLFFLQISEEALSILEEKVKVLETEKANLEKSFVDKMKTMEKERKAQQAQVDKKLLVLKEREKVMKKWAGRDR
jgi:hypothetical protein